MEYGRATVAAALSQPRLAATATLLTDGARANLGRKLMNLGQPQRELQVEPMQWPAVQPQEMKPQAEPVAEPEAEPEEEK